MEHRLQIVFAHRPEDKIGEPWPPSYRVTFAGEEIGVWRDPEPGAARWLLDHGKATREDTLQFYHGDDTRLRGQAGWLADRRVEETATISPRFVKWKPFPGVRRQAGTAKKGKGVV